MITARIHPRLPVLSFGLLLLAIYATEAVIVGSHLFPRDPDLVAGAITLDLTVLVPALFYLLVVRTTSLPGISVVPVFLLSLFGSSFVLPADHQSALDLMKHLVLPAELMVIAGVGVRVYRGMKGRKLPSTIAGSDLMDRIDSVVRDIVPIPTVARAVTHEIAILYYALFSWRSKPEVRERELGFTYHQKNGYTGVLLAVAVAALVETLVIHVLVEQWSKRLAWVLTVISLYGFVWLLGYLQAVRLRPIRFTPDWLDVRIGLLWSVRVPYQAIASVRQGGRDMPERWAKDYLHAVTIGNPQLLVELREPVDVHGMYGYTKRKVRRIGIAVDQRDRFVSELVTRVEAAS